MTTTASKVWRCTARMCPCYVASRLKTPLSTFWRLAVCYLIPPSINWRVQDAGLQHHPADSNGFGGYGEYHQADAAATARQLAAGLPTATHGYSSHLSSTPDAGNPLIGLTSPLTAAAPGLGPAFSQFQHF